jgi:hypothetical protein
VTATAPLSIAEASDVLTLALNTSGFAPASFTTPASGAGVAQTVIHKLGERISILDYGADPTGVADSTTAIQAALNAVLNGGSGNGGNVTVWFPDGTFLISANLTLAASYTTLQGGQGSSLKKTAACTLTVTGQYCSILNLRVNGNIFGGNGLTITPSGSGSANSCLISHCSVSNNGGHGISCTGTTYNVQIVGCFVNGNTGHGISGLNMYQAVISSNVITANTGSNIYLLSSEICAVTGNMMSSSGAALGALVLDSTAWSAVTGNVLYANSSGPGVCVRLTTTAGSALSISITGNSFVLCSGGIYLQYAGSYAPTAIVAAGNSFTQTTTSYDIKIDAHISNVQLGLNGAAAVTDSSAGGVTYLQNALTADATGAAVLSGTTLRSIAAAGQLQAHASGNQVVVSSNPVAWRWYLSSDQGSNSSYISGDGTVVTVNWSASNFSQYNSVWVGSTFTIPIAGVYMLEAQVFFVGGSNQTQTAASLVVNGSTFSSNFQTILSGTGGFIAAVRAIRACAVGDTVYVSAQGGVGGNSKTNWIACNPAANTFFAGVLVG